MLMRHIVLDWVLDLMVERCDLPLPERSRGAIGLEVTQKLTSWKIIKTRAESSFLPGSLRLTLVSSENSFVTFYKAVTVSTQLSCIYCTVELISYRGITCKLY
jgi:hypothetical protein